MGLDRQRLDAELADTVVPAREARQVVDARHLVPDEVGGVVRDALRVRLGEADRRPRSSARTSRRARATTLVPGTCRVGARHVPGTGLYKSAVSVERLAALILERQPCVVLTGAGVSTESGIPDFRSPAGSGPGTTRWSTRRSTRSAATRSRSGTSTDGVSRCSRTARPNAAHEALAGLERDGLVRAIVTQNVDRLHELAGSRDVVEVHGSIRTASCLTCGATATLRRGRCASSRTRPLRGVRPAAAC